MINSNMQINQNELSHNTSSITDINKKDKRILWLINHTTLREFEVPLLISMGYEVYTPKHIPAFIENYSGSVDYSYDSSLTIPQHDLDILNRHDFYTKPITQSITSIINRYFGTAILVFYPNILEQVTKQFEGRILLRAFGLDKNRSYSAIMQQVLDNDFLKRLQTIRDRFWFSEAYANLHEVESELLASRSIFHPLGLPKSFYKNENTWKGTVKKLLFFCARISTSPEYYGQIYKTFKKHFGDLPYTVAGNQPTPVNDPHVAGLQPRSTINEWLQTYAVMFYHSQEPRHLHYHPLEAIVFGMPLIYMRGGLLEQLGGDYQPGACHTFAEAKEKIKRILKGDEILVNDILKHQKKLLVPFSYEYNRDLWEQNFVSKILSVTPKQPVTQPTKTIGVFLPVGYQGGTLNGAKNIAKMLRIGSQNNNDPINVVFSCLANIYNVDKEFADLKEMGIQVRETEWKLFPNKQLQIMQLFSGQKKPLPFENYLLPTDGINNFNDCDFWLIISDRLSAPLAPFKPYGIMVYDYIQRYVPDIIPAEYDDERIFSNSRNANYVFTTTPATREDAIQFAGLKAHQVYMLPMEFKLPAIENPAAIAKAENKEDYFIWTTNSTCHKNHAVAIEALDIYYNELDGQFDVIMTGVNTELFDLSRPFAGNQYVHEIRNLIEKSSAVKKHLKVKGNLSPRDYATTLLAARFLWHPAIVDNGTYSVIEAAYYGIPSVSSNYPQMQFINDRFNLNLEFFDSGNPTEMALALKKLELNHQQKSTLLPSKEFLTQFSYENLANECWNIFRSLV